jgi:23S rRNA pseudouridine2605 synthase
MNALPESTVPPDADAVVPEGQEKAAADTVAKPVRKRRLPKVAAEPAPADAGTEASAAHAPSVAREPDELSAQVPIRQVTPEPVPEVTASAERQDAGAGEPGDAPETGQVGESGEAGPRSRRRRRDRRRGERGERPEGSGPDGLGAAVAPQAMAAAKVDELFAEVVSGAFDSEESAPKAADAATPDLEIGAEADVGDTGEAAAEGEFHAPKRVLAPEADAPKLHKVLAQSGIGSRRDMEDMITEGRITVNGEPAHVGQRISFGDRIALDGKPVKVRIVPPAPRIIAYHKPVGEVVTHDDPQHRPTVFRRLPRLPQGKWQSVGRLDINTEGLLLFTNSGELANQLMHPRFGVEREYAVRVLGTLDGEGKAKLLEGVDIEGQTAAFRSIEDGGGEGANHWYRVVITEGRNREVRKLFDAVGLTVSRLIRIRYGTVVLPRGLKRGVCVDLDDSDVRNIRRLASGGQNKDRNNERGSERQNDRGNDRAGGRNQPRPERQGGRPNDRGPSNRGAPPQRPRDTEAPVPEAREFEDDAEFDIDPMNIPNPLEQTFDKRFVQNPRSPAGGRGFGRGGGGFGAGGSAPPPSGAKKGTGPKQPDPMQTSVGYIGADAFHRKNRGGGGGGGGRGGNRGGGGGGGGFGGGFGGGGNAGGGGRRGR